MLGGMLWCTLVLLSGLSILYVIYTHYQKETYYAGLIKNLKVLNDFHSNNRMQDQSSLDSARLQIASYFEHGQFEQPYSAWFWQIRELNGDAIVSKSLFDCELIDATVHCPNSSKDILANESGSDLITSGNIKTDLGYKIYKTRGILNQNLRIIVSNYVEHPVLKTKFQYTVSGRYMGLDEVGREFFIILSLSGLVLLVSTLLAILLSIKFGFRPLERIRKNLIDMKKGKAEQMIGEFPSEIKPLVDEFHTVFQEMNRLEVENLSHNLKTPLSVLINESSQNQDELSQIVKRQTQIINKSIEHYLQRSKQAIRLGHIYTGINLNKVFEELKAQFDLLVSNKQVNINFSCKAMISVKADQHDLVEVLAELILNASKYTNTLVTVSAKVYGSNVVIEIEDDGPGIGTKQKTIVLNRGVRLADGIKGTGIGLAACNNKIQRMQGSLVLKDSSLGGLRAVVTLPAITPSDNDL